jgi:hypothetical protein
MQIAACVSVTSRITVGVDVITMPIILMVVWVLVGGPGGCGSLCTHCSVSVLAADVQGEQSREPFSEPHEETLTDAGVA